MGKKKGNIENLKHFEPGQSGNPAGRPKGARSLSTILKEMLEQDIVTENENGNKIKKQCQDVIIQKLLQKGAKGDLRAITEILDRVEGKPIQAVKSEGTSEVTIKFSEGLSGLIKPA